MVVIQIETREAVLIGRLDLSQAMGIPGKTDDPNVSDAVDQIHLKRGGLRKLRSTWMP
jgi:2-keto-3-deoxy-L-rhamnonate aldolase RhmA